MSASFPDIADQFFQKIDADFDVPGYDHFLEIKTVDTLSQKQIGTIVTLMQATWKEVDRHVRTMLVDGMGVSKFFVLCNDRSSQAVVAFAKYGPVPKEQKISVDAFAMKEEYTGAAVHSLAKFFGMLLHNNMPFHTLSLPVHASVKDGRRSKCTTDIGLSRQGITEQLSSCQGLADIRSMGSYSVEDAAPKDHALIARLHNSTWSTDPIHEQHLAETGEMRRHRCVVVRAEDKSIAAFAVCRVQRDEKRLDIPAYAIDPFHTSAVRTLAEKLDYMKDIYELDALRLHKREAVGGKERRQFAMLVAELQRFMIRTEAKEDSHLLQETLKANLEKLSQSSMFGQRVKEAAKHFLLLPIDGTSTRNTVLRRAQRFVKVITQIAHFANGSGQDVFLPAGKIEGRSCYPKIIKQPLYNYLDRNVTRSLRHKIYLPEDAHLLQVHVDGSNGAAAVFTPPSVGAGRDFALHSFLPFTHYDLKERSDRAGGAYLACELLHHLIRNDAYRGFLEGYPMAVARGAPKRDVFVWQQNNGNQKPQWEG